MKLLVNLAHLVMIVGCLVLIWALAPKDFWLEDEA